MLRWKLSYQGSNAKLACLLCTNFHHEQSTYSLQRHCASKACFNHLSFSQVVTGIVIVTFISTNLFGNVSRSHTIKVSCSNSGKGTYSLSLSCQCLIHIPYSAENTFDAGRSSFYTSTRSFRADGTVEFDEFVGRKFDGIIQRIFQCSRHTREALSRSLIIIIV